MILLICIKFQPKKALTPYVTKYMLSSVAVRFLKANALRPEQLVHFTFHPKPSSKLRIIRIIFSSSIPFSSIWSPHKSNNTPRDQNSLHSPPFASKQPPPPPFRLDSLCCVANVASGVAYSFAYPRLLRSEREQTLNYLQESTKCLDVYAGSSNRLFKCIHAATEDKATRPARWWRERLAK